MITVRPARAGDFDRLAGEMPPQRVLAWAAEEDGALLGVGGVMLVGGSYLAFVDLMVEAARYPVALHRTAKRFLKSLDDDGIARVVATTDPASDRAKTWLTRLGFKECGMAGDRALFVRTAC